MPEPQTLPDLAEVLAEVNLLRDERGMDPLTELPKGFRCMSQSCPLAYALNGTVGIFSVAWATEDDGVTRRDLPDVLYRFRYRFDEGFYPDLVA